MTVVVLLVSSLVVGGFAAWLRSSSDEAAVRRAMRRPSVAVGDAEVGKPVKLEGRARYEGAPLRAPLSGRPCACYRLTVEGADGWTLVESGGHDFLIEDASGAALVAWAGASLLVDDDWETREVTPALRQLLARHDRTAIGVRRATEGLLVEGQGVAVVGTARREPDPTPSRHDGYRELPTRLALRSHGPLTLLVSAGPAKSK